MEYSKKLSANPAFKVEKFDNEILLYAVSKTKGIYLNETAYLIWEMCAQENSLGEIISFLGEVYPGAVDSISADVVAVVESLVDAEAIIIDNA